MDFGKGALVFTTFAAHMHSLTISYKGFPLNYRGYEHGGYDKDKVDAIKAFLIIAFLLYLIAFLLQVIARTGEDLKLGKKIIGIILFILLLLAGLVLRLHLL